MAGAHSGDDLFQRLPSLPDLATGTSFGSTSWLKLGISDLIANDSDAAQPRPTTPVQDGSDPQPVQRRCSGRIKKSECVDAPAVPQLSSGLSWLLSRTATVKQQQPPTTESMMLAQPPVLQRVRSSKRIASNSAHSASSASAKRMRVVHNTASNTASNTGPPPPWSAGRVVQTQCGRFALDIQPREHSNWSVHSPSAHESVRSYLTSSTCRNYLPRVCWRVGMLHV